MGNLLQLKEISMPVFILVMFFAMSSWIDLYGVYVEIPYFVTSLPEGWALPSQLGMAVDAANIAPLLYLIAVKLCPGKIKEWPIILIIIGVGMAMCLSLVFLWDQTASIAGKERSVGLLSAASILALVDCTSSVVYIPYMAKLKTQYLTAYFIGEGFGSLIPGLVGLVQGIGSEPNCVNSTVVNFNETIGSNITEWKVNAVYDPPRFSVEVYFLFLFGTVSLSGISFLILHFSPFCKKEHIEKIAVDDSNTLNEDNKVELLKKSDHNKPCEHDPMNTDVVDFLQINTGRFIVLLILTTTLIFSIFGTLFIIIPYSAMPYGNVALNLVVRLMSAAVPVGAFLTLFHSATSLIAHVSLTMVSTSLVGYHVFLAYCSPYPPMQGTSIGTVLVVGSGVLAVLVAEYTFASIGAVVKRARGSIGLMWYGACTQLGGLLGTVICFIIINVVKGFSDKSPCE